MYISIIDHSEDLHTLSIFGIDNKKISEKSEDSSDAKAPLQVEGSSIKRSISNTIARGRPSQLMISKKEDKAKEHLAISLSPVPASNDESISPAITKKGTLDDASSVHLVKKVSSLPMS